jgi:polyhydroxyalkanoate synthase
MATEFDAAWQALLQQFTQPLSDAGIDPAEVMQSLARDYAQNPARWNALQQAWHDEQRALWSGEASHEAVARDRRFRAPAWREPWFERMAHAYLSSAQWLRRAVDDSALPPGEKRRAAFLMRQWLDALSPANFAWSNPEAIQRAHETQGASLAQGLANLRADLPRGMVSMTDERAFELGKNLATTSGAVVFENELLQLIQYRPSTGTVYGRPLLMVPPCINKYYVLDLQPENSLVRYAIAEGHTVFMVSWRNMPRTMGHVTWDDYVEQGVMAALAAAARISGARKINALGFCVGGTLLATALAVLRARRKAPVASLTLLATMLDFHDTGELGVFITPRFVERREQQYADGGVVPGHELARTFASLRANELVWNYVVSNYLKGETPPAFDLLYWNSDSTNLPGAMYCWYVRHAYLENRLKDPGALSVCGTPLDYGRLDMPAYVLATREDHIVPWTTAYSSAKLLKGKTRFVLGASGHIAGVINPASLNRRSFWSGGEPSPEADTWLASAQEQPGSWWPHWSEWLARHSGKRVAAHAELGGNGHGEIEAAPGRYVRERLD